jgi:hypothetical protein
MSDVSVARSALFVSGAPLVEDAALRALSWDARRQLGELWRSRAHNELVTSAVFAQLHAELRLFGAAEEVLTLAARAVDDEAFHSELCRLTAELYLGEPVAISAPSPAPPPAFPVCSPRVQRALFAALHSAVNETLAVTYLSACLADAQSEAPRRVLKQLLSDEVRHARIGWAVLASPRLSSQDRDAIASFMPALLDLCVGTWLADNEAEYPDELATGHGCITHTSIARTIDAALDDVILPGLEHVGIDARAAQLWRRETRR